MAKDCLFWASALGWPHPLMLRLRNLRPPLARTVILAGACLGILALAACRRPPAPPPPKLGFNEAIEPILSQNCYQCHGPDPGGRKAGLRLDRSEFAFAPHGKSGPAIVPHDPDHSPLMRRIQAADLRQVMPPPEAHKSLAPNQIALLRRWISEGAEYQDHWAFVPPQRPALPAIHRSDWVRTPIDAFILARLEREHLAPAPEADRPALIRRVTYDLTGLPPTPEEVGAFVADASPQAYERLVDRLLASPRYGEHRSHYWLDSARYGDTQGLHADDFRSIWPYRDYVIKSFNRNKPFDQFTREQIAGDLLDPVDVDQQVATAFIRAGVSTGEGGSVLEELRVLNQRERTEAFGAVYLGLTTGCAVCHDHKFDPITQKDFYQLTAFFNNLAERASDAGPDDWPPFISVPKPGDRAAYNAVLARRSAIQRQLDDRRIRSRELVAAWLAAGIHPPQPLATDGLTLRLRCDEGQGAVFANVAPAALRRRVTATGGAPVWGESTWLWPSFRLSTSTALTFPEVGDVEKDQAFSVGTWFKPHYEDGASKALPFGAIAARNQGERGWELFYDRGRLSLRLIHSWPDRMILVETLGPVLESNRLDHVLATYDGSGRAAGVRLYVNGAPQQTRVVKDHLLGSIRTLAPLELAREHPDMNQLRQAGYQDFRFYLRALSPAEAQRLPLEDYVAEVVRRPAASWNEDEAKAVSDFYFAQVDGPSRELAAKLPGLDYELEALAADGDRCLVCEESPRLAYADVLVRGVYNARAARVRPAVPHFLPPLAKGAPVDRRALAEWIVSPANPLTARVTVNRMWQELFGTGIVETTDDFGLMGDRPSHPELLDWLAVDFREHGWDVKRFYKQLVMSATYRQSARATPEQIEKDPHNRLLARGPRFRMDVEMVRDTALAASGLLVEKIGGPSVKPYQPANIWETNSTPGSNTMYYVMDHGSELYRRSLYTFWKRMMMPPNLDAFDAPARDGSCTRRQRTNTPLQALVAMNDPQWLEAARCLGERVWRGAATPEARIDYLGRRLEARPWRPEEKAVLERALAKFRAAYAGRTADAAKLVTVGESRPDPKIPAVELAPWMLVASAALNLDATLNK